MEYKPSFTDQLDKNYISHHGIKGMKWGVRRYQNSDGSYTSAGKSRRKTTVKKESNARNGLSDKTKKRIIKGLGTAAVIGGIAAYGKANGGTGPIDSYVKGVSTAYNKLSGKIYRQSVKRKNSTEQNEPKYNDLKDAYYQEVRLRDPLIHPNAPKALPSIGNTSYNSSPIARDNKKERLKHCRDDDLYLMHHGIKGMHWGVRRFEDASGHLTPAGKRRYAVQDARKYYKINRLQRAREKSRDADKIERLDKRIRRVQTRSDRKHADLSQKDLNVGRQIVAKNRRNWAMMGTAAKAAATAAGAYALYQNPKTRALVPAALVAGGAMTFGSAKKVPYYAMEARRYKQVNPKGAMSKGLTKRQKALRKVGKVAAGAALAGAAGYALYKTGAAKAAIDRGKSLLPFGTAAKEENNSTQKSQGYSKQKTGPSDATRAVLEANQRHSTARKVQNGTAKVRSDGKDRPMSAGEQKLWEAAREYAKSKGRSAIRKKLTNGVDEDDPRTWVNAVRNATDAVSTAKRYGRAVNNLRKGDKAGAAAEVSEDLNNLTNNLIEGTKKQINKARRRKSKE